MGTTLQYSRSWDQELRVTFFNVLFVYTSTLIFTVAIVLLRSEETIIPAGIYQGNGKVVHFVRQKAEEAGSSSSTSLEDKIAYALFNGCSSVISPPSIGKQKLFECLECGDQSHLSGIIVSCLDCFLDGCELNRFEYEVSKTFFFIKIRGGCCSLIERDPAKEVLHRANYLYQKRNGFGGYSLFENNCEDFAMYCMTGKLVFENDKPVPHSTQIVTVRAFWDAALSLLYGGKTVACVTYFIKRWKSDLKNMKDVRKVPVENLFDQFNHEVNHRYLLNFGLCSLCCILLVIAIVAILI